LGYQDLREEAAQTVVFGQGRGEGATGVKGGGKVNFKR